ncbi:MAG: hypothetical protein R1F54_10135 [Candidatus Zeuxoniibacter abyssi]|nr:MAG: hypothetical protein R1F54_10135 [Candidatus Persebacteraceae bacterium AB1(2)]
MQPKPFSHPVGDFARRYFANFFHPSPLSVNNTIDTVTTFP